MATNDTGKSRYPGVRWRETKKGRVYEARWRDKSGKSQGKSGFATAKEADDHLADVRQKMRKGATGSAAADRETWASVQKKWIKSREAKGIKARTIEGYKRILKQHFSPWDKRAIAKITPSDVTELMDGIRRANGTRPSSLTQHNIFNVASGVFKYAARHQIISASPASVVREDLPKRSVAMQTAKERVRFLSPTEVNVLADAVRVAAIAAETRKGRRADELRADGDALIIKFAAWSGLRRGEIGGLRLRHLDPLRNEVRVEETVTRVRKEWVVGTPKTQRSKRTVPLPATLVREVLAYTQATGCGPDDYIWGSGLTPRDMASFYRRRFLPAAKKAELTGVRMHDLRHSFASLMAHHGHKPQEISAWMGHSSVSFTLDVYTHLFHDDEADARRNAALDAAYVRANN